MLNKHDPGELRRDHNPEYIMNNENKRILKYLIQKHIFCPVTGIILDVKTSKLIELKKDNKKQLIPVHRDGVKTIANKLSRKKTGITFTEIN